MRGFPLINTAVILVALGLILIPMIKLTSAPPKVTPRKSIDDTPSDTIPVEIEVRHAHQPEQLSISHLGKEIWTIGSDSETQLVIPEEGVDLLVQVRWPEGTPESAVEISLAPQAMASLSRNLWGKGDLEEILTFVWP